MAFTAKITDLIDQDGTGLLAKHESWERVPLSDVASILNGAPFDAAMFNTTQGVPLARIRDVLAGSSATRYAGGYEDTYILEQGDLLVGMDGDFNSGYWGAQRALLNQRVCKLIPDQEFYGKALLGYVLPGYLAAINANTPSVTVKHLSSKTIAQIDLPLPPLAEQTRIVEKLEELLSDLDAGVAELRAAQRKLARYRQSLLKAAVEGALTADWRAARHESRQPPTPSFPRRRESMGFKVSETMDSRLRGNDEQKQTTPDNETGAELLRRILVERRAHWEAAQLAKYTAKDQTPPKNWQAKYKPPVAPDTTDLPALPEGWVWASAEQICDFITKGTTPSKRVVNDADKVIPFLRVTNLTATGSLNLTDRVFVSDEIHRGFLARSMVYPGDVLMNIVGPPLGQVSLVPDDFPEWNINQAIAIFRPLSGVSQRYLCEALLSSAVQQWLRRRAKTTAGQTNLTLELCRSLPIPLPPVAEQDALVSMLSVMADGLSAQNTELATALRQSNAQRQNILKAAFAGQLVPQDPSDEPASALLERIRAARVSGGAKRSGNTGRKSRGRA